MSMMDKVAQPVGITRLPGESDAQLMIRVTDAYKGRPYGLYLPLFRMLEKLGFKSTRWMFSKVPK